MLTKLLQIRNNRSMPKYMINNWGRSQTARIQNNTILKFTPSRNIYYKHKKLVQILYYIIYNEISTNWTIKYTIYYRAVVVHVTYTINSGIESLDVARRARNKNKSDAKQITCEISLFTNCFNKHSNHNAG